jgi:hypothetical protein
MIVLINGVAKNVLLFGNESEVLDETLDSATFSFIDSNPLPLAPMQRVEIRHEDMPSTFFVTISDSVEPYTPTSNLYKHEVTCAERTRLLSKRMLRNSVFSQPPTTRVGRLCVGARADVQIASHREYNLVRLDTEQYYPTGGFAKHLTIPSGEKCSKCTIKITTQVFMGAINDNNWTDCTAKKFKTYDELRTNLSTYGFWNPNVGYLRLKYKNANNLPVDEPFQLDGTILNGEIDCPQIKNLLNSGATDIYLKTTNDFPLYFQGSDGFPTDSDVDGYSDHLIGFSVQIEIIAETYIHTAYSILQEIASRLEQEHTIKTYDGASVSYSRGAPFSLPQSGELYTLLNNTITPNMTFTQCSVYEAVAEVFRLFDAIFTMDANGVLGITYFNEKTGDATIKDKAVAINSAIGEERYINGLMCYYQDARVETSFPKGDFYAPLSSKQIGVVNDHSQNVFRTPSPIHDIIALYQKSDITLIMANTFVRVKDYEINMTDYVVEKSIWSSTLSVSTKASDVHTPNDIAQINTITYSIGEPYIEVGMSYSDNWNFYRQNFINATKCALCLSLGKASPDLNMVDSAPSVNPTSQADSTDFVWTLPRLRIEYRTTSNGVFKVESYSNKFNGEMPIDQASGAIDLGKAGLNLLGLSFKMGEPTLNVTHRATSWEDRIQKGFVLTYQGEQWTANNCRYTCIETDVYQGQISFVKNYNELSLNKNVLREKRLSSISNQLTQRSEEILTEYCYVYSVHDGNITDDNAFSCWNFEVFFKALANSVNAVYSGSALTEFNDCSITNFDGDTNKRVFIPTIVYGAGDVICFEMSFEDPMVASIRFNGTTQGFFKTVDYYADYVRYTDAQGKFSTCYLDLEYDNKDNYGLTFPVLPPFTPNKAFSIGGYKVNKQPNEIFAFNYQMAFIPKDPKRVIIGKAFIENNFFTNGKIIARQLYFYYSNDTYSVMDTKGRGSRVALDPSTNQIRMESEDYYCYIRFSPSLGGATYNSWAVCDENGDILFACNSSEEAKLYFTLAPSRL